MTAAWEYCTAAPTPSGPMVITVTIYRPEGAHFETHRAETYDDAIPPKPMMTPSPASGPRSSPIWGGRAGNWCLSWTAPGILSALCGLDVDGSGLARNNQARSPTASLSKGLYTS